MTIDYLILPDDAQSARAALYAHHFLTHSDEDEGKTAVKSAEWNRSLLAHLSAKGGFSVYDYLGGAPTAGYMVCTDKSTEKTCTMAQVVADPSIIEEYYDSHTLGPREFFGAWLHTPSGLVFFDVSTHKNNIVTADQIGWDHHQLAVYDIVKGKSCDVEDPDICNPNDLQFPASKRVYARNRTHFIDQVMAMVREGIRDEERRRTDE